jgi:two-component system, NtrC family, response regulator AtoC
MNMRQREPATVVGQKYERSDATVTFRAGLADEIVGEEVARPYFLVFEGSSTSVVHLPSEGEMVIGRSSQADLHLADSSASRRHAALRLRAGAVIVADLGSHNGTRVNGELITGPRPLRAGDAVTICDATLVLQRGSPSVPKRLILDEAHFLLRLEEELERTLRYQPQLQLLCVDFGEGESAPPAEVAAALAGKLRLIDVAGHTGRQRLMLILPELDADEARKTARELLDVVRRIVPTARVGHAGCPSDGCDIDTLLAGARSAAAAAPPGELLSASELVTTREIGGRVIVIADPAMVRCYALIERLAESDLPVLIHGETGTGKEIAAQALHSLSPRKGARMVTLNCAALQDTLVESELFGYEKGAFSGAAVSKPGLLESAHGGTVFLDEVAELSAAAQAKLLRVLETRMLTRLGDLRERAADIRLVAATHRDLDAAIHQGRFREDLYFRLSAAKIVLPPLRDRRRELGVLARTFLAQSCARLGRPASEISPAAMQVIHLHRWPGNLRELRNAMEFVAATVRDPVVLAQHLPDSVLDAVERTKKPSGGEPSEDQGSGAAAEVPLAKARSFRPLDQEIQELERTRIAEGLEAAGGVRVKAAQLLSMPLRTFATKLKQYGLGGSGPPSRK